MVLMSSCTGIHNVPCHSNADCNLQLYSEFIKVGKEPPALYCSDCLKLIA